MTTPEVLSAIVIALNGVLAVALIGLSAKKKADDARYVRWTAPAPFKPTTIEIRGYSANDALKIRKTMEAQIRLNEIFEKAARSGVTGHDTSDTRETR